MNLYRKTVNHLEVERGRKQLILSPFVCQILTGILYRLTGFTPALVLSLTCWGVIVAICYLIIFKIKGYRPRLENDDPYNASR